MPNIKTALDYPPGEFERTKMAAYLNTRWAELELYYNWYKAYQWQMHGHLVGYNDQVVEG
jgi:hypothetical protein